MKMLFTAHAIPGRLAMETGDFWGDEAACPTPRLGLSFSVVRFPSPFRGVSFYSIEGGLSETVPECAGLPIDHVRVVSFRKI